MTTTARTPYVRFIPMAAAGVALLMGLDAGLIRLGWVLPLSGGDLVTIHGPLMVCGFLGTLIALERAVALDRGWGYASPLFAAAGTAWLLINPVSYSAILAIVLASIVMIGIYVHVLRVQFTSFSFCMMLGAVCWLIGNVLWLMGRLIPFLVPWWIAFLLLTIAGERLEMSRLVKLTRGRLALFWITVAVFLIGAVLITVGSALTVNWMLVYGYLSMGLLRRLSEVGARVLGIGMLGLGVWMLLFDVARRTVRQTGLARYAAISLLAGHVWLVVGGLLWLTHGLVLAGPAYDAALHAIFLGFVFSMIFAHAPIILPAVLGVPLEFTPWLYVPLVILHASLVLRIVGDLRYWQWGWMWGGMLSAIAIVLFVASIPVISIRSRRAAPAP